MGWNSISSSYNSISKDDYFFESESEEDKDFLDIVDGPKNIDEYSLWIEESGGDGPEECEAEDYLNYAFTNSLERIVFVFSRPEFGELRKPGG